MFDDNKSLKENRDELRKVVEKGAICPCCRRLAKVYKRDVNAGMGLALITMYQHYGQEWFQTNTIDHLWPGRSEAMLAYWDLIEESKAKRPDGGKGSWWRVTDAGVAYINDELKVIKYKRVYDGRVLSEHGPMIGIRDSLAKKFNYDELMSR